jgi:threonine dehydrogenase-like Zn-dependent dehydrogenase
MGTGLETIAILAITASAATAGASTYVAVDQANQRNAQIKKSQELANKQLTARRQSMAEVAAQKRRAVLKTEKILLGRLRASATARGGSPTDRTTLALGQQVGLGAVGDLDTIASNLATGRQSSRLQTLAQLNSLQSRVQSPGLIALKGSLSAISTSLSGLSALEPAQPPESIGLGFSLEPAPRSQFGELLSPPPIGHTRNLQL